MTTQISFKDRVCCVAIDQSKLFKEVFVDQQYLICSYNFQIKDYYIIKAERVNFLHLVGVNTKLKANIFFEKCLNGNLSENDFDFKKYNRSEKEVIGIVRKKINSLAKMNRLFENELYMEENFHKNNVECSFATSDGEITVGFTGGKYARPKTLLKGNKLGQNTFKIDLILSKKSNEKKFNTIVFGRLEDVFKFKDIIGSIIDLKYLI